MLPFERSIRSHQLVSARPIEKAMTRVEELDLEEHQMSVD